MFHSNSQFINFVLIDTQWNMHVGCAVNISDKNYQWKDVDTSKYEFPSEIWIVRPTWEIIIKVITILPILIIGILANISLILVIMRTKSLRTTTNLLVMNMAVADLGICALGPWMLICIDIFQNYVLGHFGCRTDGFFIHALTLIVVFSLSAISYDQLVVVVFNCVAKLSMKTARIVLVIIWIISIAVASPLVYFRNYYERKWKNYLETFCTEDSVLVYPYWHIFMGISVWLPLAIMAICYTSILIKLDRYESQALKSTHPIVMRHKGRITKTLALVVLVFIVCRVPFTGLLIRRAQLLQSQPKPGQAESMYLLWYISRFLVLLNAALNPILYGYMSRPLQKELIESPGISWIIRRKKQKNVKACNASQSTLMLLDNLKPRSPCIRNDKRVDSVPNISSNVTSVNV